jgi:hypothetical protein
MDHYVILCFYYSSLIFHPLLLAFFLFFLFHFLSFLSLFISFLSSSCVADKRNIEKMKKRAGCVCGTFFDMRDVFWDLNGGCV